MRRKISPKEIVFVLWSHELQADGAIEPDAQLHMARSLYDGRHIFACDMAQAIYDAGAGYYQFPFLRWIAENGPICPVCKTAMYTEGLLVENVATRDFHATEELIGALRHDM